MGEKTLRCRAPADVLLQPRLAPHHGYIRKKVLFVEVNGDVARSQRNPVESTHQIRDVEKPAAASYISTVIGRILSLL